MLGVRIWEPKLLSLLYNVRERWHPWMLLCCPFFIILAQQWKLTHVSLLFLAMHTLVPRSLSLYEGSI